MQPRIFRLGIYRRAFNLYAALFVFIFMGLIMTCN